MNRNQSLKAFSGAIGALGVGGLLFFVVGLIVLSINANPYDFDLQGTMNGVGLIYIGIGFLGLAIFGSFLRITAESIIEGVAISLRQTLGQDSKQGAYLTSTAAGPTRERSYKPSANSPVEAPAYADQSDEAQYSRDSNAWAQRNLSSSNYEWWTELGKPNLMLWVREGRPDFKEWIKANKR